jgi:Fe-S cluster assembly protein SufD
MNTQLSQREWFEAILAQNRLPPVDAEQYGLNTMRQEARQAFAHLPIPNRKQEAWRYTDLSELYAQHFEPQHTPMTALEAEDIEDWIYSAADSYRLVFANGQYTPTLSTFQSLPDGIRLGSLREAITTDGKFVIDWLARNKAHEPDVFSELNRALLNDGLFLHVAANVEVPLPIEVVYLNLSFEHNTLAQPHSLVILEDGARAKLVERFISTGDSSYFFNGMSELVLGNHAALHHSRTQAESMQAHHLSRVTLHQATASEYRGMQVSTGGRWSRTDYTVQFNGQHAACDLQGIYAVGDQQYSDVHLDVRHAQPGCRSREDFRGIVYGKGRAVFDGRVVVEKAAQKSDAMLSNKNLLLSENAEVDTKPQLEIYADDVKCGHGTTVGRLDPAQVFYLRSRGIAEATARRMLCLGFAEQILAQVNDAKLHSFLTRQIMVRLAQEETG